MSSTKTDQFLPGAKQGLSEHPVIRQTPPVQGEPDVPGLGLLALADPTAPETDAPDLLSCGRDAMLTGHAATASVALTIGGL